MITVNDLMKFCVKHGVTISVEASPTPNMVDMPVVNIKVSDFFFNIDKINSGKLKDSDIEKIANSKKAKR